MANPHPIGHLGFFNPNIQQQQQINFEIYQGNFRNLRNRLVAYSRLIYGTLGPNSEQYVLFNDRFNYLAPDLPRIHRNEINEINESILTLSDLLDNALEAGGNAPEAGGNAPEARNNVLDLLLFNNIRESLEHLSEILPNEQNQVAMANVR